MTWQVYHLMFRVLSPIHVGFERIGNLQRTRPYLPGRNLWAAVAGEMVLNGKAPSYAQARTELDKSFCFGYLFPTLTDGISLSPNYRTGELSFGSDGHMNRAEFEYRLLGSTAHTALTLQNRGAEEGSLHEVEAILARARPDEDPVQLSGVLFVRQTSNVKDIKSVLEKLQVGGERTYGMGRIQLLEMEPAAADVFPGFTLVLDGECPVAKGAGPVAAHWVLDDPSKFPSADGEIEVLIGRDTSDSGYGVELSSGRMCWAPGSIPKSSRSFRVLPQGIWEEVPSA